MQQRAVWRRGSFTVPVSVSKERVELSADRYERRFGNALEAQGYKVLKMVKAQVEDSGPAALLLCEPDRVMYVMWALVTRDPFTVRMEVDDREVPMMEKLGFRVR